MSPTSKQDTTECHRRKRILEAARKLIAQHGFEATSTKAIAAEAGVPSGLLFYYFETKDQLIEAIFDEAPHAVQNALEKARNSSRPLEVFLRTYYDEAFAHRYHIQIITAAVACSHRISQKVLSWRGESQTLIAEFLRSLSPKRTASELEMFAYTITASIITEVLLEEPRDASRFIEGLISFVRSGLAL